jgi:hypothetical protein
MKVTAVILAPRFQRAADPPAASRGDYLRELAQECRQLAAASLHESVRRDLILVAERFERLARFRDQEAMEPYARIERGARTRRPVGQ